MSNETNPTVGHIGQLTTTQYIPFPNHDATVGAHNPALDAANARIKELEEQLNTKYWEGIRAENDRLRNTATLMMQARDSARQERDQLAANIVGLNLGRNMLSNALAKERKERDALREQVGKMKPVVDKVVEIRTAEEIEGHNDNVVKLYCELTELAGAYPKCAPSPSPCPTCEKMSAAFNIAYDVIRDAPELRALGYNERHSEGKAADEAGVSNAGYKLAADKLEKRIAFIRDRLRQIISQPPPSSSPSTPENPPAEEVQKPRKSYNNPAARISLLRNALEEITSTAKEVKTINTPEFMEHLRYRTAEAEEAWNEDVEMGRDPVESSPPASPSRDKLGKLVRNAWIAWAKTQPHPKLSWLASYEELSEEDKEADRQIGEALYKFATTSSADAPREVENGGGL